VNAKDEIRKAIADKLAIIGTKVTLKELRKNNISKIFMSKNCPEDVKEDFEKYASLNEVKIEYLTENNESLGMMCQKPFMVSILGLKRAN
jgi:large subunit ribosomal protein L30e